MTFTTLIFLFVINVSSEFVMQFETTEKTFAYYMNSTLFQNLKKEIGIPGMYTYTYGFFIGNLKKSFIGESNGDLGIKIIQKNGQAANKQARCTETEYILKGYNYVLLCDAKEEFGSLEISPQDSDTIEIQGYSNIKFTVDENYSSGLKGKYIALILVLLLFI